MYIYGSHRYTMKMSTQPKVPSYVRGVCGDVTRTCEKTKGTQGVPLGTAKSIAESKREKYETAQGCRECIVEQSTHNF